MAQESLVHCSDSTFCVPGVYGVPRSKGLVLSYEVVSGSNITATSDEPTIGNGNGTIDYTKRLDFRFKFPIVNDPKMKIAMGFHYYNEEYDFGNLGNPEYEPFTRLNDRNLKSIGSSVYVVKPFLGNKYFVFRGSFDLNGDYSDASNLNDFAKFSFAPLYGVKVNPFTTMAFGAALSFDFGDPAVYPVFIYNRTLNSKWGIELTLPVEARVRRTFNPKSILYGGLKLEGAGYNITPDENDTFFDRNETIQISKSELKYYLNYEHEIHDYLWFGVNGGWRSNINFNLTAVDRLKSETIIDSKLKMTPYANLSLFIVPPRKWLE